MDAELVGQLMAPPGSRDCSCPATAGRCGS